MDREYQEAVCVGEKKRRFRCRILINSKEEICYVPCSSRLSHYIEKSLMNILSNSMHYNPFHYIRSEKDILKLVNTVIANTKGEGEKSTEDFWVSATRSQAVKSLRTVLVY